MKSTCRSLRDPWLPANVRGIVAVADPSDSVVHSCACETSTECQVSSTVDFIKQPSGAVVRRGEWSSGRRKTCERLGGERGYFGCKLSRRHGRILGKLSLPPIVHHDYEHMPVSHVHHLAIRETSRFVLAAAKTSFEHRYAQHSHSWGSSGSSGSLAPRFASIGCGELPVAQADAQWGFG